MKTIVASNELITALSLIADSEIILKHTLEGITFIQYGEVQLKLLDETYAHRETSEEEYRCGDYPAPCNCDDPIAHSGH